MSGKPRTPAYFAVARGTLDHQSFMRGRKPLSRYEAWLWLIEHAAWRPQGHRHVLGIVDLERAELSFTLAELSAAWRWAKTNVHRYLHYLQGREMILLRVIDQRGLKTGPKRGPYRNVITICNYNKFQPSKARADSQPDSHSDYVAPQLPGLVPEISPKTRQTDKSLRKEKASNGVAAALQAVDNGDKSLPAYKLVNRPKPPHGARSGDRRMIWLDHGTTEWRAYAENYREAKGVDILPRRYQTGAGNWFLYLGETQNRRVGRYG